jgi:hypothetical protein
MRAFVTWAVLGLKIRILMNEFWMALIIKFYPLLKRRVFGRQVFQHLIYFWWCIYPFGAHGWLKGDRKDSD